MTAAMETGPAAICPCLGSWQDPVTPYGYSTDQNACYADPAEPREIPEAHQDKHCLAAYAACPYFRAPEPGQTRVARTAPEERKRQRVSAIRLLFLLLLGVAAGSVYGYFRPQDLPNAWVTVQITVQDLLRRLPVGGR